MDTFFEQIIPIRKNGKSIALTLGIWFLALLLSAIIYLFLLKYLFGIAFFIICGIFFGAWKLSTMFNIEYEYIITNGTMDIDKIVNKSSRKRMLSLELNNVTRLEKFNPHMLNTLNPKSLVMACNQDDPEAYLLVAERDGKVAAYLVFAPEERLRTAMTKFVPKFIINSAFK